MGSESGERKPVMAEGATDGRGWRSSGQQWDGMRVEEGEVTGSK